jgi:hypothetical protein
VVVTCDVGGRVFADTMPSERVHAYYLRDLGYLLRERAEEATRESRSIRKKRAAPDRTTADAFAEGLAQGYYEVISVMLNQAESFGIPPADLALEDLDPERDLG